MGGKHSKHPKLRHQSLSLDSNEPKLLGASSVDLIYKDDYFDDNQYLKKLEIFKERHMRKKNNKLAQGTNARLRRFEAMSVPNLPFKGKKKIPPVWSRASSKKPSRQPTPKSRISTPKSKPPTPSSSKTRPQTFTVKPSIPSHVQPPKSKSTPATNFTTSTVPYTNKVQQTSIPPPSTKTNPTLLTSAGPRTQGRTATTMTRHNASFASTPSSGSTSTGDSAPQKKKLIVRGLKNFVSTHRPPGGGSAPPIWYREFPQKSKFHPDKYIYDWNEGPKAPPRPLSAMAKCKKHGGKCDNCGIFTSDLCQQCRKCELDCGCPKAPSCPSPDVYSEVFGNGWKKTCQVLCDLRESEKRNPVGGNSYKRRQNLGGIRTGSLYKSQIDVLDPCNPRLLHPGGDGDSNYNSPPSFPPPQQAQPYFNYPMCSPPMMPFMHPMSFMPMPMMPPPMPFYPPCESYATSPYTDSFIPPQNF